MRSRFDKVMTVRLQPDIRAEIARLAEREDLPPTFILRRAVAAGLAVIGDRESAAGHQPASAGPA